MSDLEIYVRDLQPERLIAWLETHFDVLDEPPAETGARPGLLKGRARYLNHSVRITVYPEAFGKAFSSVLLEGESLPWNSDLDCARSAWRAMEGEIRCSPGEWKEGDPVDEGPWWRLDHRGEQLVAWN